MKKLLAFVMSICMVLGCFSTAYARALPYGTGTAIPQGGFDVNDPAELTAFLGKTLEECKAYIAEKGITTTNKTKFYTVPYRVDEENLISVIRKIDIEEKGCALYGLQYGSDFSDLTEKMISDGWMVANKQFEGGHFFWWLENVKGDAKYSMFIRADGSRIFYMTFEVNNVAAHIALQQTEFAE